MIVNKYTNGGGGGYVLPTATDSRLGGIKVGAGLDIDSGGTLSVSGGTGGGGDYIVTDALSSITNPTSGMVAYVPFHYEDRGAVKATYELNDPTQYKEFYDAYICTFNYMGNGLSNYMNYNYNPSEPENSWYSIHGWEGDEVHYQSDNWVSWDREGFAKCRRLSNGTLEFIVETASTITDLTFNDIDDFTKTVSTGLTPVAGRTYIYLDGQWLIKDIEIREQKVSEYMPSLLYMANNDGIRDIFTISILNTIMTGYEFTPNNGSSVKVVGISTNGDSDSQRCRVIFEKNGDYSNTWYISTMSRTGMNPDFSDYQKKHWAATPYHSQEVFDAENGIGIYEDKYRIPFPGYQPKTGQTYSDIWFTVPGMVTIGDGSITITSGGTDYSINDWDGLMIDGQNYNPEDTLPIDITWDYDGATNCLHIHGNLEVSSLPDSPSESTTTFEPLPAAFYLKATKVDQSADIHEWTPVTIPSFIIHDNMTQEEMAAVRNEIVNHLWQEYYYVGSRQFIITHDDESFLAVELKYEANSGGNEIIVIKGSVPTATITKNITTGVYSLTIVH